MLGDRLCEKCGQLMPPGVTKCPVCSSLRFSLQRETILVLCALGLITGFMITGFAVRSYSRMQDRVGWSWYVRGEQSMTANRAAVAVVDYRTALAYSRNNVAYQLRLAQALVADGRRDEAQDYLTRLWSTNPSNGPVNLELGRLAMARDDVPQVIQYFHNAIDGNWTGDVAYRRRTLRQELCQYLIRKDRRPEALAELMALSSETPDEPELRVQVAELFMKARDYDVALRQYQRALVTDRRNATALAGAGEAAFQMADYRQAQRYLYLALLRNPRDRRVESLLRTSELAVAIDPFTRGLSERERARRVLEAFRQATNRLDDCARQAHVDLTSKAPGSPLAVAVADAKQWSAKVSRKNFQANPDLRQATMEKVFAIEQLASSQCGQPQGLDLALLLLAHSGPKNE